MPLLNPPAAGNSTASTATPATVVSATNASGVPTSTLLVAANPARKGVTVWNSTNATLFLELGLTATTTAWAARLSPDGYYELPFSYTGPIAGIWSAANGSCFVRELT